MLKLFVRQSDGQSPPVTKPSQQLWASAACPTVDHDARAGGEVSSSGRSSLSPSCVGIMAAAGGIAVANLYYNQPMLPDIGRSFGVAADVIAFLPMLTQIGYALGLFLFVPLGDIVDRHQLVVALLFGIIVSQLTLRDRKALCRRTRYDGWLPRHSLPAKHYSELFAWRGRARLSPKRRSFVCSRREGRSLPPYVPRPTRCALKFVEMK
jgi:hypothetical protein